MAKSGRNPKKACYTGGAPASKKAPKATRVNSNRRTMSDFLFAKPSFGSGIARLVDFGVSFDCYNHSRNPAEADTRALVSDWYSVGDDMAEAIRAFKKEEERESDVA